MDPDNVSTPTNEVVRALEQPGTEGRTPIAAAALPTAVTTADQVQIKIVGQAPPHPQAAGTGMPLTPPLSVPKLQYKFPPGDVAPVTLPIVLSQAPPHKRLTSMTETDSSCDEVDDGTSALTKVLFEVRVCVGEGEEVRITGNTSSLGSWDVFSSVKLNRSTEHGTMWSVELDVPFERPIKYRYLITRPVSTSVEAFCIVSWETFLGARRCILKKPRNSEDIHKDSVEYGVMDGELTKHIDAGWLVGTSELHLQLGTLEKALSISDHPPHTHYLLTVTPFTQAHSKTVDCSPLKAKLCSRSEGDCVTFDLASGGCPYDQSDNLVIFTTESVDFQHTGFTIDVFKVPQQCSDSSQSLPVPLPPTSSRVGRASLLPQHYLGESRGSVVLTMFSQELLPVGTLSLCFLLISPVSELPLLHSTKHTYSNYWRQHQRMLHIGHRGLGDSHHSKLKATVTENTISSLKMAGTHGADYVEFDVHLTRDQVAVVYHNFVVATTLAREGFFSGELYAMAVRDLSISQLQSLKLEHSSSLQKKLGTLSVDGNSSSSASEHDSSGEMWGASRDHTHKAHLPERKTFPMLKTLFRSLPKHIGFDIEIKYPLPEKNEKGEVIKNYSCFDINLFADIVLRDIYRLARGRKIILTCFNPDMCTVLRRKQHRYPVLFLTCALNPDYGVPLDLRGHSLNDAIAHATAHNLLGIVPNSTPLLQDPQLVKKAKEKNLVLFTWGHENNVLQNIAAQESNGVDAVIYDCINHLLPGPQKNIFLLEKEKKKKLKDSES